MAKRPRVGHYVQGEMSPLDAFGPAESGCIPIFLYFKSKRPRGYVYILELVDKIIYKKNIS